MGRPTAVYAVADRYLETSAALDPCGATESGIAGYDDQITDYSPDGVVARDNWWMLGLSLLTLPLIRSGMRVTRVEGLALLGIYCAYVAVLLTRA